jgi:hypothetical protein
MTQTATDLSAEFMDEDLRGLALILDYAHEQARKLDLADTSDFITRAARSLDTKLATSLLNARDRADNAWTGERPSRVLPDGEISAWPTPEYLGGPIILDEAS